MCINALVSGEYGFLGVIQSPLFLTLFLPHLHHAPPPRLHLLLPLHSSSVSSWYILLPLHGELLSSPVIPYEVYSFGGNEDCSTHSKSLKVNIHILGKIYICHLFLGYVTQDKFLYLHLSANFIILFPYQLNKILLYKCNTFSLTIHQLAGI